MAAQQDPLPIASLRHVANDLTLLLVWLAIGERRIDFLDAPVTEFIAKQIGIFPSACKDQYPGGHPVQAMYREEPCAARQLPRFLHCTHYLQHPRPVLLAVEAQAGRFVNNQVIISARQQAQPACCARFCLLAGAQKTLAFNRSRCTAKLYFSANFCCSSWMARCRSSFSN